MQSFRATLCTLFVVSGVCAENLLIQMGIDSKASRQVREQEYKPKRKKAPPSQHAGAEGMPPLPLPVVPLRRTEKKNPPRPPVLIGKVATDEYIDWATSPDDVPNLLRWMAKSMDVHFSSISLPQRHIPADAKELPVLYRSGIRSFHFTEKQRNRLRRYLLSGGTLILNAYCGHPAFAKSAFHEMKDLLPESVPYRLRKDHPLYSAYYSVDDIQYRPLALEAGADNGVPSAVGMDINTRTAVFFFRYDLSTAWGEVPADRMHIIGYERDTAFKLGANLASYVTAQHNSEIPLSQAKDFVDAEQTRTGKLAIAQVRYGGIWKPREASLPMLLETFHRQTNTPVRFARQDVRLVSEQLFEHPLLYMAGTIDFSLNKAERRNLREYLRSGGVLFAEATCGRESFDKAFRRELGKILPQRQLRRLPPDHLIFQYPNSVKKVTPRPALAHRLNVSGKISPVLYGINIDGQLAVIYSPYDLSGGYALAPGPYNEGIADKDALALGVNVLFKALMQ